MNRMTPAQDIEQFEMTYQQNWETAARQKTTR